jgi:ATP-dependent Zn protease
MIEKEQQRMDIPINAKEERAQGLLRRHRAALEALAQRLLEQETVDGSAVTEALTREKVQQDGALVAHA